MLLTSDYLTRRNDANALAGPFGLGPGRFDTGTKLARHLPQPRPYLLAQRLPIHPLTRQLRLRRLHHHAHLLG